MLQKYKPSLQLCILGQSSGTRRQLWSQHKTGKSTGQWIDEQRFGEDAQDPSSQSTVFSGHWVSFSHWSTENTHWLFMQRMGRSRGQMVTDGQASFSPTQRPSMHRFWSDEHWFARMNSVDGSVQGYRLYCFSQRCWTVLVTSCKKRISLISLLFCSQVDSHFPSKTHCSTSVVIMEFI